MKELQLDEELSTLELSKLPNDEVIDEFYQDKHIDQGEQGQDNDAWSAGSTTVKGSTRSKISSKQTEKNSEASADERFESFENQPGGESSPEQLFNEHFDLENLQEEEINRRLQDAEQITLVAGEASD